MMHPFDIVRYFLLMAAACAAMAGTSVRADILYAEDLRALCKDICYHRTGISDSGVSFGTQGKIIIEGCCYCVDENGNFNADPDYQETFNYIKEEESD